jgi:hypothetical protein
MRSPTLVPFVLPLVLPVAIAASLLASVAPLAGCSSDKDDTDDTGADSDADADADADTDSDADSDTDTGAAPTATLTGTVQHEDGSPWEGVQIELCLGLCRPATTDADGTFVFSYLDAGRYSLTVVPDDVATILVPVDVAADVDTTLSAPFVALPYEGMVATGAGIADMAAGTGLTLTVDPTALTLPFGASSEIGGVMVPKPQFPPLDSLPAMAGAVWYLGTYNGISDPPMPFVVENVFKLPAGDAVEFYNASYIDHDWLVATATVSEDGLLIESDPGQGVTSLTTLAMVPSW